MDTAFIDIAKAISDGELISRVKSLAARERGATAELVAHLAELEARRLHVAAGYASMFVYCRDVLLLSEHEAYNRIEVARAARRYPVILEMLVEGAVNLTSVRLLAPHLTDANHAQLLGAARGLRTREVEEVVARLAPAPDVPASIRKLPAPRPASLPPAPSAVSAVSAVSAAAVPEPPSAMRQGSSTPAPVAHAAVTALAPERYKLQLTIGGDILEKLQLAKDLLRHALPSGDDAAVLERALDALLTELMKKKFAVTDRPRPSGGVVAGSRHVPAEVKRAVFLRDRGRCAYVGTGRRCNEPAFVEFHHVHAYAHGGVASLENIELRCRRHNAYEWTLADVRICEDEWLAQRSTRCKTSSDMRVG